MQAVVNRLLGEQVDAEGLAADAKDTPAVLFRELGEQVAVPELQLELTLEPFLCELGRIEHVVAVVQLQAAGFAGLVLVVEHCGRPVEALAEARVFERLAKQGSVGLLAHFNSLLRCLYYAGIAPCSQLFCGDQRLPLVFHQDHFAGRHG